MNNVPPVFTEIIHTHFPGLPVIDTESPLIGADDAPLYIGLRDEPMFPVDFIAGLHLLGSGGLGHGKRY